MRAGRTGAHRQFVQHSRSHWTCRLRGGPCPRRRLQCSSAMQIASVRGLNGEVLYRIVTVQDTASRRQIEAERDQSWRLHDMTPAQTPSSPPIDWIAAGMWRIACGKLPGFLGRPFRPGKGEVARLRHWSGPGVGDIRWGIALAEPAIRVIVSLSADRSRFSRVVPDGPSSRPRTTILPPRSGRRAGTVSPTGQHPMAGQTGRRRSGSR